eukprot:353590-Chlamydomonas_euryale.AAC.13
MQQKSILKVSNAISQRIISIHVSDAACHVAETLTDTQTSSHTGGHTVQHTVVGWARTESDPAPLGLGGICIRLSRMLYVFDFIVNSDH